jgi:dTDP-4-dehydrorhamnose reductase
MDSSRLLIIGAAGQLGSALRARFPEAPAHDVDTLDITDWEALSKFSWNTVDTIVNAAAYTDVDGAQTPDGRAMAWQVNARAVAHLSRISSNNGTTLVHISTDYVFDGTKSPHSEDEPLTPLSVYGQSKAAGDIVAAETGKVYILRTSWLIGSGKNFVRSMIGLASKNVSPEVVNDQVGRPTFAGTLVDAVEHLLLTGAPFGTYNVSNDGAVVSWCAVAQAIFELLGRNDLMVSGITTGEYEQKWPGVAPRPLRSALDLTKIKATGLGLRDWRDDLVRYVRAESAF